MITKRRLALLTSLSATPLFAAPFLAIGDNAELFVTARAEARYEDNVTFSSSDELEDESFELTPGVELLFGKNSLTKGSLVLQERLTAYSDNTNLNSDLFNAFFESAYEGAKLSLGTNASFRELNQNSRDVRSNGTLNRRDVTDAGVDAEYAVTEKSKVGVAANYSKSDYKTGGFTDQQNYTIPVNYYFAITPKVDLSAGFQYRNTDVKDTIPGRNSDSEDYYFNVGARGEFTPKLSGRFNVGYNLREPDASDRDDETSIGLKAGLSYAYSEKTALTLDLSRDFETGADASGIETSSIALGASTNLSAAWRMNATVSYSLYDYLSSGREDDYIIAGLGATYTYNEHLSFDAGYTHYTNSSDTDTAEFTANIVRIAANFRY